MNNKPTVELRDALWKNDESTLYGAFLRGVRLDELPIKGIDFSGSDLRNAKLSGVNMHEVTFSNVNLTGADLSGLDIPRAVSSGDNIPSNRFFVG